MRELIPENRQDFARRSIWKEVGREQEKVLEKKSWTKDFRLFFNLVKNCDRFFKSRSVLP